MPCKEENQWRKSFPPNQVLRAVIWHVACRIRRSEFRVNFVLHGHFQRNLGKKSPSSLLPACIWKYLHDPKYFPRQIKQFYSCVNLMESLWSTMCFQNLSRRHWNEKPLMDDKFPLPERVCIRLIVSKMENLSVPLGSLLYRNSPADNFLDLYIYIYIYLYIHL